MPVAWLLLGLAVVAGVAGLFLFYQSGHRPVAAEDIGLNPFHTLFALIFSGVGALIASRRPSNPVGWFLTVAGFLSLLGVAGFGYGYVYDSLEGPVGPLPGVEWVAWFSDTSQSLAIFLGTFAFLLFLAADQALSIHLACQVTARWPGSQLS